MSPNQKELPEMQERFASFLERHRGILVKVAGTYCRDAEERADLTQEIASQLWRAFPAYDPDRSFSTWMYRVALNVAISHARSRAKHATRTVPLDRDLHDGAVPEGGSDSEARVRALYAFIGQLDELNRALLLLYLDEHSYREIAEILGISETNVSTKLSRLKQRLRMELKG